MDDDDFGELYDSQTVVGLSSVAGSLHNSYSSFAIFDDEIEDEKAHVTTSVGQARSPSPSPPPRPTRMRNASVPATEPQQLNPPPDRDSDEDDDMLLLGYNSKSGAAGRKMQADGTQGIGNEDTEEDFALLIEIPKTEDVADSGQSPLFLKSNRSSAVCLPGMTPSEELMATSGGNHLVGHPNCPDVINHTVTIPGLSTPVNAPFFDMEDNDDGSQDAWEQQQIGKSHLRSDAGMTMNATDDWDTDSDDDLRIVLNTDYPYYAPGEKGPSIRYEDEEDEDDEDLIIFAGGEPNEEGEDQLLQGPDGQAIQGDGLGEKQTGADDNKTQLDKVQVGVPPPSQGPRGYGYHNFSSLYKYVRAGATTIHNASTGQAPGGRGGPLKLISGRGDWRGTGRGAFGPHSTPQFSSWSALSGHEVTLPPSMTVFEIDLDSFDEKPWHQSAVDISDFFNFGFDEATWKDYCKQLAQLRLESTMQSKIKVYESGRNEQDYDPDLPPELAVAAGLLEAGDKVQQRFAETDANVTVTGRRGYMSMVPFGRPIEVEGGLGDRRPSADSRKQRIRDCDSILLIDAVEIEDLELERLQDDNVEAMDGEVGKDELEEQQQDEQQEDEEREQLVGRPRAALKTKQEQRPWQNERMPQAMSKPLAEERRDIDLIRNHSMNLHQDVASKHDRVSTEKDSRPSEDDTEVHKEVADVMNYEGHGGMSAAGRVDDSTAIASRERVSQDVQADSSGCSSKRQRLVSPEGSHTASWDDGNNQKSARSDAYPKEHRDSGESAMDDKGDALRHRKKHHSYSEMSRGDQHRNVRQGSEVYRKKQALSRPEGESELPNTDTLLETRKRPKQGLSEKVISKELTRLSKDRDDTRLKEDPGERRGYVARETVQHNEKIGSRSEAMKRDEEDKETAHYRDKGGSRPESRKGVKEGERRDRHESRRRDSEDRRDRVREDSQHRDSREIQHRDKDVEPTDWHSSDRRKKDDEYRRKDRLEDAGSKRERERSATDRHGRNSSEHARRKEEDSVKEKHEDRNKSKTRDGTLREREDLQQKNTDCQDSHGRAHKNEERMPYSGRSSRRHDEDRAERAWRGREESRLNDNMRSSEVRSHSKDRRKGPDDFVKEKSKLHEGRATRSSTDNEGIPVSETYNRDSAKQTRLSDDPRISERGLHTDKHKFDSKRAREFEKEAGDLATQLGDSTDNNSKRKASAMDKNGLGNRKKMGDLKIARTRQSQGHKVHLEENKDLNDVRLNKLSSEAQHFDDRGSSGEDDQQRGRSKLERWMSHKDLEPTASGRLATQSLAKRDEKLRSRSKDKQHRDSPGLQDDLEQESRHHAPERKNGKGSFSTTEQTNGTASKPKEEVDELVQSKDMDICADKKDSTADHPDYLQEDTTMLRTNMAAKLEKRKERFKVLVEDKDNARKMDQEESIQLEKDDSRQERPPRKRRWASG